MKIPRSIYKFGFALKKASPTIFTVAGVAGFIGAVALAINETPKAQEILEKTNNDLEAVKTVSSDPATAEEYTEDDKKKDITSIYCRTAIDLAKNYAPTLILCAASSAAVFASHDIMKKRIGGLTAAYGLVQTAFSQYRDAVKERYGEEVDKQLRYGIKAKKVSTTEITEDGEEVKVKKTVDIVEKNGVSQYAKFFDESSPYFKKDPEYNLLFLRSQQHYANDLLKTRGHVFLNEVYDCLGIPRTKAGQVVGWVYGGDGDDFIDFGLYDIYRGTGDVNAEARRDFVNGLERCVLLDFNVDGPILDEFTGRGDYE